jgi:hypothetical protein
VSNYVAIICGPRGCGKTTLARRIVRWRLDEGRWVFCHDHVQQYRGLTARMDSVNTWRTTMAAAAIDKLPVPRGYSFACEATELIELADELGSKHNTALSERFPMTLVFDEGSFLAQGTHVDQAFNKLMAVARHRGVELVFLVQRRAQLSIGFWEFGTDFFLFRQPTGRTDELESPMSLPRGALAGLSQLQTYQYVHVKAGGEIVEREEWPTLAKHPKPKVREAYEQGKERGAKELREDLSKGATP